MSGRAKVEPALFAPVPGGAALEIATGVATEEEGLEVVLVADSRDGVVSAGGGGGSGGGESGGTCGGSGGGWERGASGEVSGTTPLL